MSIVERYRIINRLGDQKVRKFGEIFAVESRLNGRKGVMKAVRKGNGTQTIEDCLRHEAGFSFDFPGLPDILDFHDGDKEILLVRNFTDGIPLHAFWQDLRRNEQAPFLCQLTAQLIPLFDHLQTSGITHCDLKPGNILITGNKDRFSVHLIDFGLALRKSAPVERSILFPLGYAAPELLLNHLDIVDHRTDIFALGIVYWRLCTGKLPLTHPNPSIYTNLQLTHPLPDDAALPKGAYPILTKMSYRHPFGIPPNRMHPEEVKAQLTQAMCQRYSCLNDVLGDMEQLPRPPFYQRISFR